MLQKILDDCVKVRKEKGLTQKDVMKISGLTQQMVSRIETYGYKPNLSNFLKYVNALGLKIVLVRKG